MMIPTTLEMDKLFNESDINNKDTIVIQCISCKKWSTHYNYTYLMYHELSPCKNCGNKNYDRHSIKSLRTYSQLNDQKRKPK